jgi:hypothetical protein
MTLWNICAVISDVRQSFHWFNDWKNKRILAFVTVHTDPAPIKLHKLCPVECQFISFHVYSDIQKHVQTHIHTHTHTHTDVIIYLWPMKTIYRSKTSLCPYQADLLPRPSPLSLSLYIYIYIYIYIYVSEFNYLTDDRRHSSAHAIPQNLEHRLEQPSIFIHYSAGPTHTHTHTRTHTHTHTHNAAINRRRRLHVWFHTVWVHTEASYGMSGQFPLGS